MSHLPWIGVDANVFKDLARPGDRPLEARTFLAMLFDHCQNIDGVKPARYYAAQFGKSRSWVEYRLVFWGFKRAKQEPQKSQAGAKKEPPKYNVYTALEVMKNQERAKKEPQKSQAKASTIKDLDLDKEKEEPKKLFLDFVYLTEEEHARLLNYYGKEHVNMMIERLNGYIGQIGEKKAKAKYTSHSHTIQNWSNKDGIEKGDISGTEKLNAECIAKTEAFYAENPEIYEKRYGNVDKPMPHPFPDGFLL